VSVAATPSKRASRCPSCGRKEDRRALRCWTCGTRYTHRPCAVCHGQFEPVSATQRYCSAGCREVVYPPGDRTAKNCRMCGARFTPRRAGQIICSTPCRRVYLRHRANSRIERKDVFLGAVLRDPCVYCGSRDVTGFDHITPKIEGGSDDWENLAACCHTCNSSKCATSLLLFLNRRPLGGLR
jgi:hypothetical protein